MAFSSPAIIMHCLAIPSRVIVRHASCIIIIITITSIIIIVIVIIIIIIIIGVIIIFGVIIITIISISFPSSGPSAFIHDSIIHYPQPSIVIIITVAIVVVVVIENHPTPLLLPPTSSCRCHMCCIRRAYTTILLYLWRLFFVSKRCKICNRTECITYTISGAPVSVINSPLWRCCLLYACLLLLCPTPLPRKRMHLSILCNQGQANISTAMILTCLHALH